MKKTKQVNNVSPAAKKATAKMQEAEGSPIYTSNELKWVVPRIDTRLIEQYSENALLAEPVNNLKNLIFRGEAQVTVTDPNGETDNNLSQQGLTIYRKCEIYAAHQLAFTDEIFGGCSVWSPGWGNTEGVTGVCPVEFRNLPWNSFRDLPLGFMDIYNDIMPGIVIDKTTQKARAFQKPDDRTTAVEIQNFVIIKDPTSPKPAGKPDCLPVVALITNFNYADKAWNMKMNRVAAPPIFPYVEKITAANKAYVEALAQKWGIKTSFIMTAGMDFKDPKLVESSTAEEREAWLKKRIDGYFNPATFVQKDGNSIGGSDSGAMELIYNYIDKILTMLETQITAVTLQKWLDDNGFFGYRAEIRHPRPSVKKDEQIRLEVDTLAKYGWISGNEARRALPNTDLGDMTPEQEAAQQAQLAARKPANPPSNSPVGNISEEQKKKDPTGTLELENEFLGKLVTLFDAVKPKLTGLIELRAINNEMRSVKKVDMAHVLPEVDKLFKEVVLNPGTHIIEVEIPKAYQAGGAWASIRLGAPYSVRWAAWQEIADRITKTQNDFKGVTDTTASRIRTVIADGIVKEQSMSDMARDIVRGVDDIGIVRATTMVRTETMAAVNDGVKDRYREGGIETLERLEALDERTCTDWEFDINGRIYMGCAAINGEQFTQDEADEVDQQAHPNCRGTWVPVIKIPVMEG